MNTLAVLSVKMLNQPYPIHLFAVPPVIYLRSIRTKKRSFFDGEDGRANKKTLMGKIDEQIKKDGGSLV
jgi:hypothetical protein